MFRFLQTDPYTIKVRKNLLIVYITLTDQRGYNDLFYHFLFRLESLSLRVVARGIFTELPQIHTGLPSGIEDISVPTRTTYSLYLRVGR